MRNSRPNKHDYFAVAITVLIFIGGFILLPLPSFAESDYDFGALLYLFVGIFATLPCSQIKNYPLKILTLSILAVLVILLLLLISNSAGYESRNVLIILGIGVIYFSFFFIFTFIKERINRQIES